MSRALAAKFRKHVIALHAGSRFKWGDTDAMGKIQPPGLRYREGFCVWEGLCVSRWWTWAMAGLIWADASVVLITSTAGAIVSVYRAN